MTPIQKWKAEIEIGRDAITRMLARGENLAAVETWRETYAPSGPPVFSAQRAADYKPILDRWNWIEQVFGMAEGNTAGTVPRGHDLDVVSLPAAPPVGLGMIHPIIAGALILGAAILATVTVYQLAMEAERTDKATAKNFDAWIARQPAAMQSAYKDLIASDPILKSNSWLDSLSSVGSAIGWIALAALAFFVFTQLRATLPRAAPPTPNPCKGRRGGSNYTSKQLKHVREWYATPKTKKKTVKRYYYQPEMRTHASDASW